MEMFKYAFMQRAFIVGILLAAVIPCIGIVVVCKRLSMIGDALSHTSLAGVAIGLILGINPVFTASVTCVLAALGMEGIRRKLPRFSEMSIAITMSAGIGLAGVLVSICMAVLLLFILFYKELFYISLDEKSARLAGVPVKMVNFLFTVLIAVTVSVAARTVGALIVSSMMVVPVACAIQLGKSYHQTVFLAVILDVVFMIIGLSAAYYLGLKPGGTIVLVGVVFLIVVLIVKNMLNRS